MTRKEILRRKGIQNEADIAEHNRLVRYRRHGKDKDKHYSRKKSKDYEAESKMEPWRRLQSPENETPEDRKKRRGLGGETYIHTAKDDPPSRTLDEQIKYMKDAEKSGEGRITRHGRKNLKTMQDIVDKPDYGLTTFQYNVKKAREAKKKKAEDKKKKAIDVRTLIKPKRDKTLPKTSLDEDNKKLKKLYDGWL